MATTFDPITTEVLGNHFLSVTDEMAVVTIRTAYSPNIKERADVSTALFDSQGNVIAQTVHAPVHLGGMFGMVRSLLKRYRVEEFREGDVFVGNDPYACGAIHLNDVSVVAPVFARGMLVGFSANVAHHADIGGAVPGGEACTSNNIYQEGLRLPPVRIFRQGEILSEVIDIILLNSRNERETLGDFRAQFASVKLGARRLEETIDRYGMETFHRSVESLLDACERQFRSALRAVPQGRYEFTDVVEDDWVSGGEIPIHAAVEIRDGEVLIDLRKNSPQVKSSRNAPYHMMLSTVFLALKSAVDPTLPQNSGYFRAIRVDAQGSIINCIPPAAVALGPLTCQRLEDAILGALAKAIPERLSACSNTVVGIQLSGWNPRTRRFFLDYERFGGGTGARYAKDGLDAVQFGVTNTSNLPIEVFESEYPVMAERYELVPDSGGPGNFRGGLGIRRDLRILCEHAQLSAQGERFLRPPWGLGEGMPGGCGHFILNPGTPGEKTLPVAFVDLPLKKGDVVSIQTAGGGGYGNPNDRDPAAIAEDVLNGRVTRESVAKHYSASQRQLKR